MANPAENQDSLIPRIAGLHHQIVASRCAFKAMTWPILNAPKDSLTFFEKQVTATGDLQSSWAIRNKLQGILGGSAV